MTAHKTAIAYHVSTPVSRWHARTCKALVCPQAAQAPCIRHSLTSCSTQLRLLKGLSLLRPFSSVLTIATIGEPAPLKCIGSSPHPPQTPAAQFKRSYRNCPGRRNRAQPCLVCRDSPDRNLTFTGIYRGRWRPSRPQVFTLKLFLSGRHF